MSRWTLEVQDDASHRPVEVQLPSHLDAYLPRADVRYTLRTEVPREALPGLEASLVIPHFEGLTELRVDGQLATAVQVEPIEAYRHAGPHVWHLPPRPEGDGPVRLELRVEHRWTQSAWMGTVPQLHPAQRPGAHALAIVVVNDFGAVASMAALLLIGSMSLWVFLADRSRRGYLWFSVQLLSAAYYPLHVSGYSQIGVGAYDTLLVAILLALALFAAVRFSHLEFGDVLGRLRTWPWSIAAGLTAGGQHRSALAHPRRRQGRRRVPRRGGGLPGGAGHSPDASPRAPPRRGGVPGPVAGAGLHRGLRWCGVVRPG
ncbi:hypothetical protein [Paraliomyxa miuraensis]|uniref:hypothetical protein n=1 Tax=Paraliomyxa miuraensis TaxID=376150 RepID=UPI00224D664D|nr:hypothetical protein [Paraliomyxa miuraensis]MCX4242583.1 hypothetical protein [Paraliomyxa miuraensis]